MPTPVIEPLESRIAPAALIGNVLSYTDADGDQVTATFKTKGVLTEGMFTFDSAFATAGAQQLQMIDLSGNPKFKGTSMTVAVVQAGGGDGEADIGYVNATGIDLKNVVIPGDLGRIDAGDATPKTPGLKLLNVAAIGEAGLSTQGGAASLSSLIEGSLSKLFVTRGITGATVQVDGNVAELKVGGAITGGDTIDTGTVFVGGNIAKITVTGGLVGGDGFRAGSIFARGKIGNAAFGANLLGGGGDFSGSLFSDGPMGSVSINGNLQGAGGAQSGQIDSESKIATIFISGNVLGGDGADSGGIDTEAKAGKITIMGEVVGGGNDEAGLLEFAGGVSEIFIGGSIVGGSGGYSGIEVTGTLAKLTIQGSVIGGSGELSGAVDVFDDAKQGTIGIAIIGGDVRGGAGRSSALIYAESGITHVSIAGDLIGGSELDSGEVYSDANFTKAEVTGSVIGGAGTFSGYIGAFGKMGTVTVGALLGGDGQESGAIFGGSGIGKVIVQANIESGSGPLSGYVDSGRSLGLLMVGGDIIGTETSRVPVTATTGIKTIDVAGNVLFASFLAGYNGIIPENPDASIGKVSIGGNLIATDIVAGVRDAGADGFGNANDVAIDGGNPGKLSSIGSVIIGGMADGTAGAGQDYGITAQIVKKVKIGATSAPLTAGGGNDQLISLPGATTGDYRINEVS